MSGSSKYNNSGVDSTLTKGSAIGLVAKSPSSERTLLSSRSSKTSDRETWLVASGGSLQLLAGLLMVVFGALCAAYGVTLSRLGAGLWGGLVSSLAGLLGILAAAQACCSAPTSLVYLTAYLALCLVSLAVNTLVLVLTLTALVRDSNIDPDLLTDRDGWGLWAGQWCGVGLLVSTCLHLLATLVSLPVSCKRRHHQPSSPPPTPPFRHDSSKRNMVDSWLGRHHYPPHTPPHPYFVSIDSKRMTPVYSLPYPPLRPPTRQKERERRPRSRPTPPPPDPPMKKMPPKEKVPEITEEDIDKTYTGLDREIAEEFISIAMQPKPTSISSQSSISHIFP